MIGRRGFIAGLLASAAMPMLIDGYRVVHIGVDFGRTPTMMVFDFADRRTFLIPFDPNFHRRIEDTSALSHVERGA